MLDKRIKKVLCNSCGDYEIMEELENGFESKRFWIMLLWLNTDTNIHACSDVCMEKILEEYHSHDISPKRSKIMSNKYKFN